jgi:hypothetical protein
MRLLRSRVEDLQWKLKAGTKQLFFNCFGSGAHRNCLRDLQKLCVGPERLGGATLVAIP